jgi:hypothetical protein
VSAVGFQSDSYQLVETCLARLRVDAQLDDDPVLPSIDLLPDDDVIDIDVSEVVIVGDSAKELPSAASIVRESVKANQRAQKEVPTLRRMKEAAPAAARSYPRWPVVLCALVATYCGLIAVIRSPLGAKPEVQHVVKVSRDHIASVVHSTKSLVRR